MIGAAAPFEAGLLRDEAAVGITGALASSEPEPTWIVPPGPALEPETAPPTDALPVKLPGENDEIPRPVM